MLSCLPGIDWTLAFDPVLLMRVCAAVAGAAADDDDHVVCHGSCHGHGLALRVACLVLAGGECLARHRGTWTRVPESAGSSCAVWTLQGLSGGSN